MTKKLKFVAVVESENKMDSLLLQNAIGALGKIISFEISDLSDTQPSFDVKKIQSNTIQNASSYNNSEILELLERNNKFYFESMSVYERKLAAIHMLILTNLSKAQNDSSFKEKFLLMLSKKFQLDSEYIRNSFEATQDDSLLDALREKLLEADLNMMFVFIFRNVLATGDEDFFETELIEGSAEIFNVENINEIKKMANERVKVIKAIKIIESEDLAFNKLKTLEKNVLLALVLLECSKVDGKISLDEINNLKNTFNVKLNLSNNVASFIFQKDTSESADQKQFDSLIMKIERNVTYKEKYELLVYLWEKLVSSEGNISEFVQKLIKKLLRKLDMSDVESAGARKEAVSNLEE